MSDWLTERQDTGAGDEVPGWRASQAALDRGREAARDAVRGTGPTEPVRVFAATVTGHTVFGRPAEAGTVFPAPDYPAAVAAVREAHASGRLAPLTPGAYPEVNVRVVVFEVLLAALLRAAAAA